MKRIDKIIKELEELKEECERERIVVTARIKRKRGDLLSSLNEKYARNVLIYIYNIGSVSTMTELYPVVTNPTTREKIVKKLEEDGLVVIEKVNTGRITYHIYLTELGAEIVKKYFEMEEIAKRYRGR